MSIDAPTVPTWFLHVGLLRSYEYMYNYCTAVCNTHMITVYILRRINFARMGIRSDLLKMRIQSSTVVPGTGTGSWYPLYRIGYCWYRYYWDLSWPSLASSQGGSRATLIATRAPSPRRRQTLLTRHAAHDVSHLGSIHAVHPATHAKLFYAYARCAHAGSW